MNLEDQVITRFYGEKIEAIKAADPKDETGYVKGMETQRKFGVFQEQINQLASKKDFDAIMKVIDEKIVSGEFEGEAQQQVYIFKALTHVQLKNLEDALKTLDEAKSIAPESGINNQIDMLKKRIEASSAPKP
jgi:F0F1-type ATP synthase delta subunit